MNTIESQAPGRTCPLHYRYSPTVFLANASADLTDLDVLYVVGGLYGNALALREVTRLFGQETGRKAMIFNGDFHWFDINPETFAQVQSQVLLHHAIRGNVETELAEGGSLTGTGQDQVGCGCAYPSWVDDGVVERSNLILARLNEGLNPTIRAQLAALPMWLRADVAGFSLAVVHGDATSLAGWGFAQEHLGEATQREQVISWFDQAQVDAFASTHTCLPVFQAFESPGQASRRWVFNNGAAGMPNFNGNLAGHLTRISNRPFVGKAHQLGIKTGGIYADLVAIETDPELAKAQFLDQWPAGSHAYQSYYARLSEGPAYSPKQVIRDQL